MSWITIDLIVFFSPPLTIKWAGIYFWLQKVCLCRTPQKRRKISAAVRTRDTTAMTFSASLWPVPACDGELSDSFHQTSDTPRQDGERSGWWFYCSNKIGDFGRPKTNLLKSFPFQAFTRFTRNVWPEDAALALGCKNHQILLFKSANDRIKSSSLSCRIFTQI